MRNHFAIQTGKLKHLALIFNHHQGTRPTKSIVRQSCFNTIGADIVGSVFIEGFAGCGSMGIEALSRGAYKAIFYEKEKYAYDILCKNLSLAKKREPMLHCESFCGDFFTQNLQNICNTNHRHILYLDPPFYIRDGQEAIYERLLLKIAKLTQFFFSLIIFEHWSEYNAPDKIGIYALLKTRRFGQSALTYYIPKSH